MKLPRFMIQPTAHIARIRNPLLRVPIWSLWFPHFAFYTLIVMIRDGYGSRILYAVFWQRLFAFYLVGIYGTLINHPIRP